MGDGCSTLSWQGTLEEIDKDFQSFLAKALWGGMILNAGGGGNGRLAREFGEGEIIFQRAGGWIGRRVGRRCGFFLQLVRSRSPGGRVGRGRCWYRRRRS